MGAVLLERQKHRAEGQEWAGAVDTGRPTPSTLKFSFTYSLHLLLASEVLHPLWSLQAPHKTRHIVGIHGYLI